MRLVRKLAQQIDGIDLTGRHVGDVLYLNGREAAVLIAEGWAEPVHGDVAGASPLSGQEPTCRKDIP